ncbi:MAG: hypothetical protein QMA93_03670 [Acidimicrobiales bacterium]|jgi:hypothetical protein
MANRLTATNPFEGRPHIPISGTVVEQALWDEHAEAFVGFEVES